MKRYSLLDLFSGIGGFSLGLERSGAFETVAFCEIEPFCRKVLAKHWPGVPCYDDIRTLTAERLRADGISVDAICGGFPCQDLSVAGRRTGIEGSRSGLWAEIWRLIRDLRPTVAIMENVSGLLTGPSDQPGQWFGRVLGDLAEIRYDAEWHCIPASAVGAPHVRDRVWIVAYPGQVRRDAGRPEQPLQGFGLDGSAQVADPERERQQGQGEFVEPQCSASRLNWKAAWSVNGSFNDQWSSEPAVGRVAHGVPDRTHRIAALGNAVVPQIPELIGRAIANADRAA